jgi:hypothetical protein
MKEKTFSIVLILIGEAVSILAEMLAAKFQEMASFNTTFFVNSALFAVAGFSLIGGYMIGYKAFSNIWIITVISITSLLFLEVIIGYTVFREPLTLGALLGFLCGILGFILCLSVK